MLIIKKSVTQSRGIAVTDLLPMKQTVRFLLSCGSLLLGSGCLSGFYLFEDSQCLVKHCSIVNTYKTSIGTWLEVDTYALAQLKVLATEEVTYCLYTNTEFIGNTVHTAIGQ